MEKICLICETSIGLSVLGNLSLWLVGSKVIVRPLGELTSKASFKVNNGSSFRSFPAQCCSFMVGLAKVGATGQKVVCRMAAGCSWLFSGLLGWDGDPRWRCELTFLWLDLEGQPTTVCSKVFDTAVL